ncbi:helix-turn-helix domain-containing protein [Pluralibacter gergoviae]|uniref:helix-turn-helix domain-containing protein n=1 Tax=Enterobacteriaceae TaxID=543 RepID=UPI003B59C272
MGRWKPDAESRLRAAALDLFEELDYEQTSVAAIAERAGLTACTFFRYILPTSARCCSRVPDAFRKRCLPR